VAFIPDEQALEDNSDIHEGINYMRMGDNNQYSIFWS
jgi:hypothetical protein